MDKKKPNYLSAEIIIRRNNEWNNKLRAYNVYINDKEVGKIQNGEVFGYRLNPGCYKINTKIDWMRSDELRVELKSGDKITLETGSNIKTTNMLNPFSLSPFKELFTSTPGKGIYLKKMNE